MSLVMSKESRDKYLDEMLKDGENYECKIWATIMAPIKDYFKYGRFGGALSNTYCYIGLTNDKLYVVTLDNFDADKIVDKYSISLSFISKVVVKKSIIPKRRVLFLYVNGQKTKISIMDNAIFTNIKDQKENADILIDNLRRVYG